MFFGDRLKSVRPLLKTFLNIDSWEDLKSRSPLIEDFEKLLNSSLWCNIGGSTSQILPLVWECVLVWCPNRIRIPKLQTLGPKPFGFYVSLGGVNPRSLRRNFATSAQQLRRGCSRLGGALFRTLSGIWEYPDSRIPKKAPLALTSAKIKLAEELLHNKRSSKD